MSAYKLSGGRRKSEAHARPIKKAFGVSLLASLALTSSAFGAVGQTPPPVPPLDTATCEHQAFSQPLLAFGDTNYYVLAPGGTFAPGGSSWYLMGGAKITPTVQSDGTTGGVLQLPGKSQASSPVMCITNDYPMARLFSRAVSGTDTISLNVQYWRSTGWTRPRDTGGFAADKSRWTLSGMLPILADQRTGWQQVRFTLVAGSRNSTSQIDNFWVDPRASR
jgi:hypothetical protein